MRYLFFDEKTTIDNVNSAIFIKESCFKKIQIINHYLKDFSDKGILNTEFIAFDLPYESNNKCSAKFAKEYLSQLLPGLDKTGIKQIFCCDPIYFKYLVNKAQIKPFIGYSLDCAIKGYEHIKVVLGTNYQVLSYDPNKINQMRRCNETFISQILGSYSDPGSNIIHSAQYIKTPEEANIAFLELFDKPILTVDIEALSLNFVTAGISTIAFAWDKHNGIAFAIDRADCPNEMKELLKEFFIVYPGKLIWHNGSYDLKPIIYNLWMENLSDYKGMLKGLNTMTKDIEDTLILTYLATNNSVKNVLGLKEISAEFTGNYAQNEIKDTSKIPINQLLEYNLIDCLATWFVYEKYVNQIIEENQEYLYREIFLKAIKSLCQMEMCGVSVSPKRIQEARDKLTQIVNEQSNIILGSSLIQDYQYLRLIDLANKKTAKAKKKVYTVEDEIIKRNKFNPNSDTQLREFFYDYLGYDVIDLTKKKLPAVGAKTLKKLKANAKCDEHKKLLDAFVKLNQASKILTTFIPAFENNFQLPDGSYRMYGNFKLGGTLSLRISSNSPSLMNLPSNSIFGKLIKRCVVNPKGWLFTGADFNSLESRINTLQTKDPNKEVVYTDGFDSHCYAAYHYWPEKMPDIDPGSVDSINSIKQKYPELRQLSKAPSFGLQYGAIYVTLMNNAGFPEKEAKQIETNYHKMYQVADAWAANHVQNAIKNGYAPLAFRGRLRTPLLAKCKPGKKLSYAAEKESRTVGNAITQTWCILTIRALNELMERIWDSPYKYDIMPSITIHDANYTLCRDNPEIVKWLNDNMIECMEWNEVPELQHDIIKLGAEMDIHYGDWSKPITLKNYISKDEIIKTCKKGKERFNDNSKEA